MPKQRWANAKRRSAKSGEIWEIPLEVYVKIINARCHYCDGKLNPTGCGLDRKDNELGYVIENVVPCCRECNTVKNHFFTYQEMILLSITIKKNQKGEKPFQPKMKENLSSKPLQRTKLMNFVLKNI